MVEQSQLALTTPEQFGIICLVGTFLLGPFVFLRFRNNFLQAKAGLYFIRAALSIAGMLTWMESVKTIGSGEAMLLTYLIPILGLCLASLIKEETIQPICLLAGIICFTTIVLSLHPTLKAVPYGLSMGILSSFSWAGYEVICKKQTHKEHWIVQVFYTFLIAAVFLLPFSISSLQHLDASACIPILSMSLLRISNIIFLFLALKWATLNWITPVSYLKLPLITGMGLLFANKSYNNSLWIAAAVLIGVNIATVFIRQKRHFLGSAYIKPQ